MKVYISGPMSGVADFNFPEFERCANQLRALGHEVVSPREIPDGEDWDACLKADLQEMLTCEAVVGLTDWRKSRGGRLEHMVAIAVGMRCYDFEDFLTLSKTGLL